MKIEEIRKKLNDIDTLVQELKEETKEKPTKTSIDPIVEIEW